MKLWKQVKLDSKLRKLSNFKFLKNFLFFRKSNDIVFITELNSELVKLSLNLQGLPVEDADKTEDSNRKLLEITLSVLSGVLGALLLALMIMYFLKTRSYNRQMKVLTETAFGNAEDLNKNIKSLPTLPNTNIFANEKSNPGFMNNKKTAKELDRQSIISSDSDDFAGIYDNPIFNINRKIDSDSTNNPLGQNLGRTEGNDDSSYI